MANLKELSKRPDKITGGHRMCAGCGAPIAVRMIMMATDKPVIASTATGCLEVATTIYPYTAWNIPWIHNAFENSAATMSGIETAFRSLKKQGKLDKDIKFIAFGGDGGTYDIGFQSLSGSMERGHNMVYVCYDNGAYMNTGIQRSSATPYGASTTTDPAGKVRPGKQEFRKDLTAVMANHHIPYVAQASIGNWNDLITKAGKAFEVEGPAFLNVLAPCQLGWRFPAEKTVEIAKLAYETCFWPLYEVENDEWKLNFDPKDKKKPIVDWIKPQGRFKHLFKEENKHVIDEIQQHVDKQWAWLKKQCNVE